MKSIKIQLLLLISVIAGFVTSCNKEQLEKSSETGNTPNMNVPDVCRASIENERAGVHAGVYSSEELARVRATMSKNSTKYVIPTVFHIFGTSFSGSSVTYETIVKALKSTNEDFQGLSNDAHAMVSWGDYGIEFPLFEFMNGIEFKLANIDPNGAYSTGVNFYPAKSGFGNGGGYDDEIRQYAWDNTKYLNVYIQNDLYGDNNFTNSGVAWYPDAWMTNNNTSRVVYNGAYLDGNMDGFGSPAEEAKMKKEITGNSAWGYRNENFRSVLTHEFGHWLDLKHTFDTDRCVVGGDDTRQGDDVPDTPMVEMANWTRTSKNCRGEITNWQNFMNYTDHYANFTPDQCTRIVAALNDTRQVARKSIWQNANRVILADGLAGIAIEKSSFTEKSNTNDGTFAEETMLTIVGNDTEISGNIGDDITSKLTINKLPAGLKIKLTKHAANKLKLTISGKTTGAHDAVNNTSFDITIDNSVMKNSNKVSFVKNQYTFKLSFIDAYKYFHKEIAKNVNSSSNNYSHSFDTDFTVPKISIIFQDNAFLINGLDSKEAEGAFIVCEGNTRNVKISYSGETIDTKTKTRAITKTSKPLLFAKGVYEEWLGQTGYIAFGIPSRDGATVFGWIKIMVNNDGTSVNIESIGYNTNPNSTVIVGTKADGSIDTSVNFEVSKRKITEGEELQFAAKALPLDKITSYSWAFAGGTPATSTEQNPKVIYNTPGTYNVTLTVNGSLIKSSDKYITVKDKNETPEEPEEPEDPTNPDKPKEKIVVEAYPATIVAIGDKDPILKNIPANTIVSIIKNNIIVKKIKNLTDGSIVVSGLNKGSYVYIYTLNEKLITRGKLEVIK